jgi:hypothetical protein
MNFLHCSDLVLLKVIVAYDDPLGVWVATFTLFILWLLGLLLSPLIIRFSRMAVPTPGTSESQETMSKTPSPWQARIANFTRASRDAFLLLFATSVVNQTGSGVSEVRL